MASRFFPALIFLSAAAASLAAERFVANYEEARVPSYALPDPLVCADGTAVRDRATWQKKRRPELLELFTREVYGRAPGGRPQKMHWAVTSIDRGALGGKAVRKEVTIWFTEKKDGPQMHLLLYQPVQANRSQPAPAFLGLNFYGNQCVNADPAITLSQRWMRPNPAQKFENNRATEASRGLHSGAWEVETVVSRGYATATVYYGDLCEDRVEGFGRDIAAMFNTRAVEERKPDDWGAIGIWAWGLSRALDYLEADPEIDGKRVAVHGHSRLGKAALWAGAQDERFAMVISNNSGCGGAALSRRRYGETVGRINTSFPHWFSLRFRQYNENEDALPVDQHQLLALIAPRPVHVASAEDDKWADPKGEFLALHHAEPVYALFGRRGLGGSAMPAVNAPVLGDAMAYHIRTGRHAFTPYDWEQYLAFGDRVLKK
jgi:hypothetical protein